MPIYEYRCAACGHALETMQKFSDAPLTDCPTCGEPKLKKLISAAGFQLKGSGWYATDYKGNGSKGKSSESSGDAKSESKPHGCGGSCNCTH